MSERVPIAEAARILGMSPSNVRERMRVGTLNIGNYFPNPKGSKQKGRAYIYRDKLNAYLGKVVADEQIQNSQCNY